MNRETATHYLTRKVAQIIHDTVEWCTEEPRAETDWLTAERIVRERFAWMIGRMIGEPVDADVLSKLYPDWRMADSATFEDFDRQLGHSIWSNTQGERRHLPRPPYGQITFS